MLLILFGVMFLRFLFFARVGAGGVLVLLPERSQNFLPSATASAPHDDSTPVSSAQPTPALTKASAAQISDDRTIHVDGFTAVLADEAVGMPVVEADLQHLSKLDGPLAVSALPHGLVRQARQLVSAGRADDIPILYESCANGATLADCHSALTLRAAEAALVPGATLERDHLLAGVEWLGAPGTQGRGLAGASAEVLLEHLANVLFTPDFAFVDEGFGAFLQHRVAHVALEASLVPPATIVDVCLLFFGVADDRFAALLAALGDVLLRAGFAVQIATLGHGAARHGRQLLARCHVSKVAVGYGVEHIIKLTFAAGALVALGMDRSTHGRKELVLVVDVDELVADAAEHLLLVGFVVVGLPWPEVPVLAEQVPRSHRVATAQGALAGGRQMLLAGSGTDLGPDLEWLVTVRAVEVLEVPVAIECVDRGVDVDALITLGTQGIVALAVVGTFAAGLRQDVRVFASSAMRGCVPLGPRGKEGRISCARGARGRCGARRSASPIPGVSCGGGIAEQQVEALVLLRLGRARSFLVRPPLLADVLSRRCGHPGVARALARAGQVSVDGPRGILLRLGIQGQSRHHVLRAVGRQRLLRQVELLQDRRRQRP
eukprot:scaffold7328_cov314-Pinguiococcus_pyrenoidosus.AAC.35